ncbi:hypothetical protein LCGC14_1538000, partial [marine sediment metagenome]
MLEVTFKIIQQVKNAWYDEGRIRVDGLAKDGRNEFAAAIEAYAVSMEVASGVEFSQLRSLSKARQSYKVSQRFDDAIMTRSGKTLDFSINGAPFPLDVDEGIRGTEHLLAAINKWLPPGQPKYKSLFDIPNLDIPRAAIRRRASDRIRRMLATSEPLSVEKLVANGFTKEAAERVLAAKSTPGFTIIQEGAGDQTVFRFTADNVEGRMLPSNEQRPALMTITEVKKGARRKGLGTEAARARMQFLVDSGETKFLTNAQTPDGAALWKSLEDRGWIERLEDLPTAAQKEPYAQYKILSDLPQRPIIELGDEALDSMAAIATDVSDAMRESFIKHAIAGGETMPKQAISDTFDTWLRGVVDHKVTDRDLLRFGSAEKRVTGFLDVPTNKALDDMATALSMEREDIITLLMERAEVNAMKPPLAKGQFPTYSRAVDENLAGAEEVFQRLNDGIEDVWGQTNPVRGVGNETAFKNWLDEADGRITEARIMADAVGQAARDFTLLAYPAKKNIDLAMAYIYPYQFWYSRTYIHWIERLARRPYLASGYARYRSTLEKIHAGAPEWWKYNLNSGEMLGLWKENPLFFNLEATLNPLNGMTGVDFDDPDKVTGWATDFLQNIGKFGPSTWTGYSLAAAMAAKINGEDRAAAKWSPRLIPQTATIRSVAALAGIDLELDPSVHLFGGGMGPYEQRRVGRMLASYGDRSKYSDAEIIDAANSQSGPAWDEAVLEQSQQRAPGQLASATLGIGFRPRSNTDLAIDAFDQQHRRFWAMADEMSPQEIRNGLNNMRAKFPFMDVLLLSRKGGLDRDRAFAYNVLGRIPPSQSDDFAKLVGVDPRLLSKFYDTKGQIDAWAETDREKFMAGMLDLSMVLDMPQQVTRDEWTNARNAYSSMLDEQKRLFGDDIRDQINAYFASFDDTQEGRDLANQMLKTNPALEAAMDWQDERVVFSPVLASYYANLQKVQKYYDGLMFDAIEKELGPEIWDKWAVYWALEAVSKKAQRDFWKANPDLARYGDLRDAWTPLANQHAVRVGRLLPQGTGASQRQMEDELGLGAEDVAANFPQIGGETISLDQWQQAMGGPSFNLVMDFLLNDEDMPLSVEK